MLACIYQQEAIMADDLSRRQPEDPKKINVNQAHEVRYWTEKLGVSEARLRLAVSKVGVMVADVRAWLARN